MNKPSVFISSTYVDLKNTREHIADFTKKFGLQPIRFERGGIYFDWTKPLDESCYDKVRNSDIFVLIIGGRYGSPASDEKNNKSKAFKKYNSVTKKEYDVARKEGIPIYVFIDRDVLSEYKIYIENGKNNSEKYLYVDSPHVFQLIEHVYSNKHNNFTSGYSKLEDITMVLSEQWTGMLADYIRSKKKAKRQKPNPSCSTFINGYKLFYYRTIRCLSFTALQNLSCIDRERIRLFEKVNTRRTKNLNHDCFHPASSDEIQLLENALCCPDELAYKNDGNDFASQFMEFYKLYKGKKVEHKDSTPQLPFRTRLVFFDFDGTLTLSNNNLTTWEQIWVKLGYDVNDCAKYHNLFSKGAISHTDWCNITKDYFVKKKMDKKILDEVASSTKLINGTYEMVHTLTSNGIKIYIISGSIKGIIKSVLGELWDSFAEVKSNNMVFDNGILKEIIGTKYDFQGKSKFIKEILKEENLQPTDALFVGNSCNDIYASRSGIRTLCVNPHFTDGHDLKHWTHCIANMKDARKILEFVSLK